MELRLNLEFESSIIDGYHFKTQSADLYIVCHPWNMLGGSMNDHVVLTVYDHLVSKNINVVRYTSSNILKSRNIRELEFLKCHFRSYNVKIVGYSYGAVLASQIQAPKMLISIPVNFLWFFIGYERAKINITEKDVLIIGGKDEFTSIQSFSTFINGLPSVGIIIPSAGHFYLEPNDKSQLIVALDNFIKQQHK